MNIRCTIICMVLLVACSRQSEQMRTHTDVLNSRPIVFKIHRNGEEIAHRLIADYGIVCYGVDKMTYLYKKNAKSLRTNDEAVIIDFIHHIPKGALIDVPSTCTVPVSYGFDAQLLEKYMELIRSRGLKIATNDDKDMHVSLCYCESNGYTLGYEVSIIK